MKKILYLQDMTLKFKNYVSINNINNIIIINIIIINNINIIIIINNKQFLRILNFPKMINT